MNDLSQLKPKLVRLKLSGVLETLEQRIAQAMEEKWEYSQFLLNLLTDEVIRRDNRQLTLRVGRSGLNPEKRKSFLTVLITPDIVLPARVLPVFREILVVR
jgi:hypothetical protein